MHPLLVQASAVVSAPAARVYRLIADYHRGHPSILPPQYFGDLVVLAGGVGAGTRISFTMNAYGSKTRNYAHITEPEPGRVLVETVEGSGIVTRFLVDPLAGDTSRVTIETTYPLRGLPGWFERLVVPGYLKRVYAAELELLKLRSMNG
jgi:Polyketide cyclase / dehydrase and lipid transport